MIAVQASGPTTAIKVLKQRYGDAPGGLERLPCFAGRERLGKSREYTHRKAGGRRKQDDSVGESQDPPGPLCSGELARAKAPPFQIRALGGVERPFPQAGLEG